MHHFSARVLVCALYLCVSCLLLCVCVFAVALAQHYQLGCAEFEITGEFLPRSFYPVATGGEDKGVFSQSLSLFEAKAPGRVVLLENLQEKAKLLPQMLRRKTSRVSGQKKVGQVPIS